MQRKLRSKLCKNCQKIVLEHEREYKKKHPEIRTYRRKYYEEKQGGGKKFLKNIKGLFELKKRIDKIPDDEI
ncbi:MAG: hypothetical protein ABIH49_00965 [archaeon]